MSYWIVIVFVVVSGLISYTINVLTSGSRISQKKRRAIASSLIGVLIGLLVHTWYDLRLVSNDLVEIKLSYDNALTKANHYVMSELDNENQIIIQHILKDEMNRIESSLEDIITKQEYNLNREQILNVWTVLIQLANEKFYTTNVVPSTQWKYVNADEYGIKPQLEAILRGVDVRRLNLFDSNNVNHTAGIYAVHQTHDTNNIPSHIKELSSISKNDTYMEFKEAFDGTFDVVLVDDAILLLTFVNEEYQMEFATISFDQNKIRIAKRYFEKVYEDFPSVTIER